MGDDAVVDAAYHLVSQPLDVDGRCVEGPPRIGRFWCWPLRRAAAVFARRGLRRLGGCHGRRAGRPAEVRPMRVPGRPIRRCNAFFDPPAAIHDPLDGVLSCRGREVTGDCEASYCQGFTCRNAACQVCQHASHGWRGTHRELNHRHRQGATAATGCRNSRTRSLAQRHVQAPRAAHRRQPGNAARSRCCAADKHHSGEGSPACDAPAACRHRARPAEPPRARARPGRPPRPRPRGPAARGSAPAAQFA